MALREATVEEFQAALIDFAQEVGWSMEYASLREAALMSRDSIIFSPPLVAGGGGGETKQAELTGKKAVARDIHALFTAENDRARSPAAILLNRLGAAAKFRNMTEFNKAKEEIQRSAITFDSVLTNKIVQDGDQTRSFKKAQNYFNQINVKMNDYGSSVITDIAYIHDRLKFSQRGKTKIIKGQGEQKGKFLVSTKSELEQYIKVRQKEVGKLKSAWWNVIVSLPKPQKKGVDQNFGQKGVAGYVKKFPGLGGFFSIAKSESGVVLIFGNPIGDNDNIGSFFNVMNLVYGNAVARIERDLDQLIARDVNNF